MTIEEIVNSEEVKTAVDDYRSMCFWNLAEDFYPQNRREVVLVVENLEHYGDMAAYRKAGEIRKWL